METIAAIATAPGRAGLAIVRVSGPAVPAIARAVGFPELEARRATYGRLRHPDDDREIDRVLATRFVAPASYTGEDVVEFSCHGGALVPSLVLDAVCAAGARPAAAGEFTRRAFLNGKMDRIQVEATLDLVDARSEAHHRAALFQLEGALSRRVQQIRERVLRLAAMLSYEVDFPEEDEGPIPRDAVEAAAAKVE
ncbi:MAG: tRNA uridine-5-carboxymethylaminomethyl(34) synthesis GTPase MnmE, partial [Gemmatimonadota bacterium]